MNYYQILQVSPDADPAVIKVAFRAIMAQLRVHPDKGGDHAQASFLTEAYEILIDSEKRKNYDQLLRQDPQFLRENFQNNYFQIPDSKKDIVPTSLPIDPNEKRLLSRIPLDKEIFVSWKKQKEIGRLIDLSGGGARLLMNKPVSENDFLEISVAKSQLPFVRAQVVRVIVPQKELGVKWVTFFEENLPRGFLADEKV